MFRFTFIILQFQSKRIVAILPLTICNKQWIRFQNYYITAKDLTDRKKDIKSSEKVVWLDSFEDLKNGNYNIIFKSAKYNHVRNEIDTETMTELGTRKRQQDGDEEKTHLCIRYNAGEYRFLAVHESKQNTNAVSIGKLFQPCDDFIIICVTVTIAADFSNFLECVNDNKACVGMFLHKPL